MFDTTISPRRRPRPTPRADVHREPADPLAPHLHLTGVHAGADRDPDARERVTDRAGAADRATGSVEGGEEPVAGGVDLAPAEPGQLLAHDRVVLVEERAPPGVAELGGPRGRAHDVGEEHRGEPPVRVVRRSRCR